MWSVESGETRRGPSRGWGRLRAWEDPGNTQQSFKNREFLAWRSPWLPALRGPGIWDVTVTVTSLGMGRSFSVPSWRV